MQLDETSFSNAISASRNGALLNVANVSRTFVDISKIPGADKLPFALCVLLENVVRCAETDEEAVRFARSIIEAGAEGRSGDEISYMPSRVLFQDLTGVPVFVDFAAMRDACVERGGDPMAVNPLIPATLIVDHSVIADEA